MIKPTRRGFLFGVGGLLAAPAIVKVTSIMPVKAIEPSLLWPPEIEVGDLVFRERFRYGWTSWANLPSIDEFLEDVPGRHVARFRDEVELGIWDGKEGVTVHEFERLQKLHDDLTKIRLQRTVVINVPSDANLADEWERWPLK